MSPSRIAGCPICDAPRESKSFDRQTQVKVMTSMNLHGAEPPGARVGYGRRFVPGEVIAGRFAVVRYIAHGGMGEVYEVEDRLLQNARVALKVILPQIASDAGSSQRFEQEVLLARKVVHANLCPIYDIARSDDPPPAFQFLTMKLVEGLTLSDWLERPGPSSREEVTRILDQMVAGVAAIHAAGIIHRDIKPNNVMLESSGASINVLIMDFGLARLSETETTLATQSMLAGTPGYLAPEILRGEGPSKAGDIFALGVLMHQVMTKERPKFSPHSFSIVPSTKLHQADTAPAYIGAVREFLSNVPERRCAAFERLRSALAISPSGSHMSVEAFARGPGRRNLVRMVVGLCVLAALCGSLFLVPAVSERLRGMLYASQEKHIAVLPLETVGGSAETQAVGDGLMDSLAGLLSNLDPATHNLWVIPASDVRARKVKDSEAAFREFGATIVVQGRFERSGNLAHLQLYLIDARKGRQIGYIDLQSPSGDLAAMEDEAAVRMGRLLNLSQPGEGSQTNQQSSNRAAFEDYLAGIGYYQRADLPGNVDRAISSLQSALQTDPHFALAAARLAQIYVLKYKLTSDDGWLKQAEDLSRQAAEVDSKIPSTYVALAQVHEITGNHDLAIQELQRAVSLDPEDANATLGLAQALQREGRSAEAEAAYLKAISLRPNDWTGYNFTGIFYQNTGHPKQAIEQFQKALKLTPNNSWIEINLALAYMDLDDPEMLKPAEEALQRSIASSPTYVAYADLAGLYLNEHRFLESVAASREAVKLNSRSPEVWMALSAGYLWLRRDADAADARTHAIRLLQSSIEQNAQDVMAHANLAVLYAQQGKTSQAAEQVRISLALSPHSRYVLSAVADSYELMGDRRRCLQTLKQAFAEGLTHTELEGDPNMETLLRDHQIPWNATR
jgi:tetratricopeptide (TPR) repeat protein